MTPQPFLLAEAKDIPADLALSGPLVCREYLLDGELRTWTGPMLEIFSPIFVSGSSGPARQLLGSCPVL